MKYLMKSKCFTESKTYIKTFERVKLLDDDGETSDFNLKYEIGDYVCLKSFICSDKTITLDNIAKIDYVDETDNVLPYILKFSKGNTSWFKDEYIKRLATTEEIEQYKIQELANKYNIG